MLSACTRQHTFDDLPPKCTVCLWNEKKYLEDISMKCSSVDHHHNTQWNQSTKARLYGRLLEGSRLHYA